MAIKEWDESTGWGLDLVGRPLSHDNMGQQPSVKQLPQRFKDKPSLNRAEGKFSGMDQLW